DPQRARAQGHADCVLDGRGEEGRCPVARRRHWRLPLYCQAAGCERRHRRDRAEPGEVTNKKAALPGVAAENLLAVKFSHNFAFGETGEYTPYPVGCPPQECTPQDATQAAALGRQRRHSYQPRATPWVYWPKRSSSAESAFHLGADLLLNFLRALLRGLWKKYGRYVFTPKVTWQRGQVFLAPGGQRSGSPHQRAGPGEDGQVVRSTHGVG